MKQTDVEIKKYDNKYRQQVLAVWEKSVLATHGFLSTPDFEAIKATVATINFNHFDVYCLIKEQTVAGFIGIADRKIEMLFLDPALIGMGFGKQLTLFAIHELKADKVDVNEQNGNAVAFYRRMGFEVYERKDKDDQDKNYPLLRMQLNPVVT
jgi:putative acetyltransferase